MNKAKLSTGFALLSVILFVAIISLIGVAMVNTYLSNTRATSLDLQRIKAAHLLDAGVRFAALSIASPRAKVVGSAIPAKQLTYASPDADVLVDIRNEAGFIDLLRADRALLKSALLAHGGVATDLPKLIDSIQSLAAQGVTPSYRKLRELLADTSINVAELLSVVTLHNGRSGVHPQLASKEVLALVPTLSNGERRRVLAARDNNSPSLISNRVNNEFFTSTISAYYRISVSVSLHGQRFSTVQIVQMINQPGRLYQVQAVL